MVWQTSSWQQDGFIGRYWQFLTVGYRCREFKIDKNEDDHFRNTHTHTQTMVL